MKLPTIDNDAQAQAWRNERATARRAAAPSRTWRPMGNVWGAVLLLAIGATCGGCYAWDQAKRGGIGQVVRDPELQRRAAELGAAAVGAAATSNPLGLAAPLLNLIGYLATGAGAATAGALATKRKNSWDGKTERRRVRVDGAATDAGDGGSVRVRVAGPAPAERHERRAA